MYGRRREKREIKKKNLLIHTHRYTFTHQNALSVIVREFGNMVYVMLMGIESKHFFVDHVVIGLVIIIIKNVIHFLIVKSA